MMTPELASNDSILLPSSAAETDTPENAPFGNTNLATADFAADSAALGLEAVAGPTSLEGTLALEPIDSEPLAVTAAGIASDAEGSDELVSRDPVIAAANSNDDILNAALARSPDAADIEAVLGFVEESQATHVAVKSGSFFDPKTFGGNLPGDGARVLIPEGITVTYDRDENVPRIDTLRIDGVLDFATNRDTQLLVDLLVVYTGGELRVGTNANPVRSDVDARITFAPVNPNQRAIDPQDDPLQVRRGLVALPGSTTRVVGSERTDYVTLADGGASAGDSTLRLDSIPKDWQVGDRIVLTGTSYNAKGSDDDNSRFRDEELIVTGINKKNKTISFDHNDVNGNKLRFDHQAPEGFDLDVYVANLTRNVIFESERGEAAPLNERGYTLFFDQDLRIANTAFNSMGRSDNNIVRNNPVLNADGSLRAGTGTNRSARMPICIANTLLTGSYEDEAALLLGNAVSDSSNWGFAINSSRVTLEDNVAFDVVGAGFVTVSGDEIAILRDNLAIKATGAQKDPPADLLQLDNNKRGQARDVAVRGIGFWFDSSYSATVVQGNIAVSTEDSGFIWYGENDDEFGVVNKEFNANSKGLVDVPVSSLPPELRFIAGGEKFVPAWQVPNQSEDAWSGNTSYNNQSALEVRGFRRDDTGKDLFQFGSDPDIQGVFQDFTVWGVREFGVEVRYSSSIRIEDSLFVGDIEDPLERNSGLSRNANGHGIWINKNARGVSLADNHIEGFEVGAILQQTGDQSLQLSEEVKGDLLGPSQIDGGTFANNTINLGAAFGRTGKSPSDTVVKNNPPFNPFIEISGNLNFEVPAGNQDPVADFKASVDKNSRTVKFDASESFDPDYGVRAVGKNDNSITSYVWDFDGDGKIDDFGYKTEFTYDAPGTYTAILQVYDEQGATATREVIVEVGGSGGTFEPTEPSETPEPSKEAPKPNEAPQPSEAPKPSNEAPQPSKAPKPATPSEPKSGDIAVSKSQFSFYGRAVGTEIDSTFNLKNVPSGGIELTISAFDIDEPKEAQLFLNGERLELPQDLYADGSSSSATIAAAPDLLQAGKNELTFVFASDLKGTTGGYRVDDLEISPVAAAVTSEQPTIPAPIEVPTEVPLEISESSTQNIPTSRSQLNFFGRAVGSELNSTFELASIPSGGVELGIKAFDVDSPKEAKLFLNGKRVTLPDRIYADGGTTTSTIAIPSNLLRVGKNELTFVFANDLKGTTSGYRIDKLVVSPQT